MLTVLDVSTAIYEIERSRFIGILFRLDNIDDLKTEIDKIKKEYPDARHYVYAASADNGVKNSDDGEPSGTAGRPLQALLNHHHLNNVALVVVRYFGGIKLGAGRLLRTYVETGKQAIENAVLYKRVRMQVFNVETSYADYELIKRNLNNLNAEISAIAYNINVEFELISKSNLVESVFALTQGRVKAEFKNEKEIFQEIASEVKNEK